MISRRGFLLGLGAAVAAPAIVRASSIMRVAVPKGFVDRAGGFLVPEEIHRELVEAVCKVMGVEVASVTRVTAGIGAIEIPVMTSTVRAVVGDAPFHAPSFATLKFQRVGLVEPDGRHVYEMAVG